MKSAQRCYERRQHGCAKSGCGSREFKEIRAAKCGATNGLCRRSIVPVVSQRPCHPRRNQARPRERTVPPAGRSLIISMCAAAAIAGAAENGAETTMTKAPGLIPREVLFGNPDKAGATSLPRRQAPRLSRPGQQGRDECLGPHARPGTDDRSSPPTRSAASAASSGSRTATTSSTARTRTATRTGTSTRPTSRPAEHTRPHAVPRRAGAQWSAVNHDFPTVILVALNLRTAACTMSTASTSKPGRRTRHARTPAMSRAGPPTTACGARSESVFTPDGGTLIRMRRDAKSAVAQASSAGAPDESGFGGVAASPRTTAASGCPQPRRQRRTAQARSISPPAGHGGRRGPQVRSRRDHDPSHEPTSWRR